MAKETKIETRSASNKQVADSQVEPLHESEGVKAYSVKIKEGLFTAVNYAKKGAKADFEIYWARYGTTLNHTSSEYKAAFRAVTSFLLSSR